MSRIIGSFASRQHNDLECQNVDMFPGGRPNRTESWRGERRSLETDGGDGVSEVEEGL